MAERYSVEFIRAELSGLVGEWMARFGVDRETAIWELQRLAAEAQFTLNYNRAWRLTRLEEALGLAEDEGDCAPPPPEAQ